MSFCSSGSTRSFSTFFPFPSPTASSNAGSLTSAPTTSLARLRPGSKAQSRNRSRLGPTSLFRDLLNLSGRKWVDSKEPFLKVNFSTKSEYSWDLNSEQIQIKGICSIVELFVIRCPVPWDFGIYLFWYLFIGRE